MLLRGKPSTFVNEPPITSLDPSKLSASTGALKNCAGFIGEASTVNGENCWSIAPVVGSSAATLSLTAPAMKVKLPPAYSSEPESASAKTVPVVLGANAESTAP